MPAVQIQRISQTSIRIRIFVNQVLSIDAARGILFYIGDGSDGGPRLPSRLTPRNPIGQTDRRNEFILNAWQVHLESIREEYRPLFNAAVQDQRPMQALPAGQTWLRLQINRPDLQWQTLGFGGLEAPTWHRGPPAVQIAVVGNRVIWRQGNAAQYYTVMPTSQRHYTQQGINPTAARALAASAGEYNSFMHTRVNINGRQPSAAMSEFQQASTDRLRAGLITFIISAGAGFFGAYPSNLCPQDQQARIMGALAPPPLE